MKSVLLIPIAVLLTAALGLALLGLAGKQLYARELAAAAAVAILAAEAGLLPTLLARGSAKSAIAQSGLIGTLTHMLLALVLGGALWMSGLAGHRPAFLYWLMLTYWASLAAVVAALALAIRAAPNDASPRRPA